MTDNNSEWVYMSNLVPGYVDKYTLRGIRKRNTRILKRLQKAPGTDARRAVCDELIDNNRPLAQYVAWCYAKRHGLTDEQRQDAFQECCVTMVERLRIFVEGDDLQVEHMQRDLFLRMLSRLNALSKQRTIDNEVSFVPFEEDDYPLEKGETTDTEFVRSYAYSLLNYVPDRNREIFLDYYLGDAEKYGDYTPDVETIALYYDLTRERVRQILEKTRKKLRAMAAQQLRKGLVKPEDFIKTSGCFSELPYIHNIC